MLQKLLHRLLLKTDPETAHTLAKQMIMLRYGCNACAKTSTLHPRTVFGLTFPNPVGLAAGWDKDAVCFDALLRMGFGFVEVGTVTPRPQMGNPKPRLFRYPDKHALINRMGFNNAGIDALVEKIKLRKTQGILGVNIGKNKDTLLAKAVDDYILCLKAIYPYADYVVINISSPNTEGLRDLQSPNYLNELLDSLDKERNRLCLQHTRSLPLLVKTTVDLPKNHYTPFVQALSEYHIDGVIISNTTTAHQEAETGGLSGAPLRAASTQMIHDFHEINPQLPIIGVGGIITSKDARAHWDAGASLLEIFTGFVYRGPQLIEEILNELVMV